jgi:hypothetical protein
MRNLRDPAGLTEETNAIAPAGIGSLMCAV